MPKMCTAVVTTIAILLLLLQSADLEILNGGANVKVKVEKKKQNT